MKHCSEIPQWPLITHAVGKFGNFQIICLTISWGKVQNRQWCQPLNWAGQSPGAPKVLGATSYCSSIFIMDVRPTCKIITQHNNCEHLHCMLGQKCVNNGYCKFVRGTQRNLFGLFFHGKFVAFETRLSGCWQAYQDCPWHFSLPNNSN